MISYINGILSVLNENTIIVEANGIGYQIAVSSATIEKLPPTGTPIKIHTYLNISDAGIFLYGFFSKEELELFLKLIKVNSVGPKGALAILAAIAPSQIIMAILSEDIAALSKAPGIGKKTAQRIILDLKDKVNPQDISLCKDSDTLKEAFPSSNAVSEAVEALCALGYTKSEAVRMVSVLDTKELTTEQILKQALKKML